MSHEMTPAYRDIDADAINVCCIIYGFRVFVCYVNLWMCYELIALFHTVQGLM